MYYKTLFVDLDNTLYSHDECHNHALSVVSKYLASKYHIDNATTVYYSCRLSVKSDTVGSCNRVLYFKKMVELLRLPGDETLKLNDIYWDAFYSVIKPHSGVCEFLQWHKSINIKVVVLTNFQTEHQLKKLQALQISQYVDMLITSEEINSSKPDSKIFLTALYQARTEPHEVMMIGDDYEADIVGAQNVNIKLCVLFPGSRVISGSVFHTMTSQCPWENLLLLLQSHHKSLCNLVEMSKFFGERFDLVQAGGGNISVKLCDVNMLAIKASGTALGSMTINSGYSVVRCDSLEIYGGSGRASIETTMHQVIPHLYVVHLHPIITNRMKTEALTGLFPKALILPYVKPGSELTVMLKGTLQPHHNMVFLQNHGIIMYGSDISKIMHKVDKICIICEKHSNMDFSRYRESNAVSAIMRRYDGNLVSYRVPMLPGELYVPRTPDCVAYCGAEISILDEKSIITYMKKYGVLPSLVLYNGSLYAVANSLYRCADIKDVYISNSMMDADMVSLGTEDIEDIISWDAEKYRKSI